MMGQIHPIRYVSLPRHIKLFDSHPTLVISFINKIWWGFSTKTVLWISQRKALTFDCFSIWFDSCIEVSYVAHKMMSFASLFIFIFICLSVSLFAQQDKGNKQEWHREGTIQQSKANQTRLLKHCTSIPSTHSPVLTESSPPCSSCI